MSLSGIDERPGRPLVLAVAWLTLLALACWAWFAFQGAAPLRTGPGGAVALPPPAPLRTGEVVLLFAMWSGLCMALMLPAAVGAVFVYLRVARCRVAVRWPRLRTAQFAFGCLLAWIGFAGLVTLLHWALHDAGMLEPELAARLPALGLTLVAAGAWQWTPAKHASLQHCRAPLPGVLADWRAGILGPLWQGVAHGRACLGCSWLLVLLLLACDLGNPVIVAAVALLALAELRLEEGSVAACVAGVVMVAWGTILLFP